MAEPGEVLVGVTAGEQGDEAIRQGAAWAQAYGWALVAFHVAPSAVGSHMLFPQLIEREAMATPEIERRLARVLRVHVAALTNRRPDEVEAVVSTGSPDVELVRAAEERPARLVVVGSHGHAGLRQIFLGDVAESVVRHARRPVLVARRQPGSRRVLVGTDLSREGAAAVAAGAAYAARVGARLTVACSIERRMRVVHEMTNFGSAYEFVQHEYEEARRDAEERTAAQLRAAGVSGESLVLEGKPAAAIVRAAADLDADLIVVSAANMASWMPAMLGDFVVRIVRAAPCSVLVWR